MIGIDAQRAMFDCTVKELDDLITKNSDRLPMVAMSMLSDVQEMVEIGLEKETVRRALNRAKYLIDHIKTR